MVFGFFFFWLQLWTLSTDGLKSGVDCLLCDVSCRVPYYTLSVRHLQSLLPSNHFRSTPASRKRLLDQCWDAVAVSAPNPDDPHALLTHLRGTFERWFLGASFDDIYRENWRSWVAWVFFDAEVPDLSATELDELNTLLLDLEKRMQCTFKEGYNPSVKCIRLTKDPVFVTHRPLVYYGGTIAIQFFGERSLRKLGFTPRTIAIPGAKAEVFYYRPALEPSFAGATPIVFIHGIGVGLTHYLPLLIHLPRNVPVYLLSWPHVAMRLHSTVPSIPGTLRLIRTLLSNDGVREACFVAHSLGTAAVTWMLHDKESKKFVGSMVLLDPITFLLCDPTVAFNFIYRPPTNVLELVMSYFVSREMGIAHSLSRHFHWSWNVLFVEDIPRSLKKSFVVLAEEDNIVPAPAVERYLKAKEGELKAGGGVGVVVFKGRAHGEIMMRRDEIGIVMEMVREACGISEVPQGKVEVVGRDGSGGRLRQRIV